MTDIRPLQELEALRAESAAMRHAINLVLDAKVGSGDAYFALRRAIASDAGRDWLSPEEAERLRAELTECQEAMQAAERNMAFCLVCGAEGDVHRYGCRWEKAMGEA